MTTSGNLLAWIVPRGDDEFLAAFVSEEAKRAPAIQSCSSSQEAHEWVKDQAAALNASIKWLRKAP